MKNNRVRIIACTVVSCICLTIGFTALADIHTPYERNEHGQTYGSTMNLVSEAQAPDLVLAQGEDGTVGYVLYSDLHAQPATTPDEVEERIQSRSYAQEKVLPLYDSDGVTVIGSFVVGQGTVTEGVGH